MQLADDSSPILLVEDYSPRKRYKRMTSTPDGDAGSVNSDSALSPSPSLSTVFEFPLGGADYVDRTIEIGSCGEEVLLEIDGGSEGDGEMLYPSDYLSESDSDSSDGIFFPSDISADSDDGSNAATRSSASAVSAAAAADDIQVELVDVGNTLVSGCCQQQCLLSLTPNAVISSRRKLSTLSSNERRQWITDKVFESSKPLGQDKLETQFVLSGNVICNTAWRKIYKVSEKQLSRISRNVARGLLNVHHGNKGRKRNNTKSEVAKTWMERYFHLVGDKMPHNNQIHLPSWETQKDVYQRYCMDMSQQQLSPQDTVSLSTFYRIWSDYFHEVVIPEVRSIILKPCRYIIL